MYKPALDVVRPLLPRVIADEFTVPRLIVPAVPAAVPTSIATLPEFPDVVVFPVWIVMLSEAVLVRLAVRTLLDTSASGATLSFILLPPFVISLSHDGPLVPPTLIVTYRSWLHGIDEPNAVTDPKLTEM